MSGGGPSKDTTRDTRALYDKIRAGDAELSQKHLERWLSRDGGQDKNIEDVAARLMESFSATAIPAQASSSPSVEQTNNVVSSGSSPASAARQRTVSYDQFDKVLRNRLAELKTLFKNMDANSDSGIDREELKARFRTENLEVSDEFLDRFLAHLDENKDMKIQVDELIDFGLLIPGAPTLESMARHFVSRFPQFGFHLDTQPPRPRRAQAQPFDWRAFLAGGISGALSRTATAPIDRIRVFLQVAPRPETGSAIVAACKTVYHEAGILSFWKGNGVNVLKIVPETALLFGLFDGIKKLIATSRGIKDPADLDPMGKFLAGGIAGVCSQTAAYPLDSLRTRLMANLSHVGEGMGSIRGELGRSFRELASEGWAAFFRGWVPASFGIFPFSGVNLSAFETMKLQLLARQNRKSLTTTETLLLGSLSGGLAAAATFPLNQTRTRMQAANTTLHQQSYTGALDCVKTIWATQGIRGFYQGLGVSLLKVLPSSSLSYLFYEMTKKLLSS